MKKYILILSAFLSLTACNSENTTEENPSTPTEGSQKIIPESVSLTQGETSIENALKEGIITLEQGKNYHLELTFNQEVDFIPGDFLKVKKRDAKHYFADFYGSNLKKIEEIVTFKKEGFEDFVLKITQPRVLPNYYTSISTINGYSPNQNRNVVRTEPEGKKIWITNFTKKQYYESPDFSLWGEIPLNIKFLGGVFLEDVAAPNGEKVIKVHRTDKNNEYNIDIVAKNFVDDFSFTTKLPVYELLEGNTKGEKIGEISIIGDNTPFLGIRNFIYNSPEFNYDTNYNLLTYIMGNETQLNNVTFYIQAEVATAFIENLNTEYFERATPIKINDRDLNKEVWKWNLKLKDSKAQEFFDTPIHAFDVYEGIEENGNIVKKPGATKREIKLVFSYY